MLHVAMLHVDIMLPVAVLIFAIMLPPVAIIMLPTAMLRYAARCYYASYATSCCYYAARCYVTLRCPSYILYAVFMLTVSAMIQATYFDYAC